MKRTSFISLALACAICLSALLCAYASAEPSFGQSADGARASDRAVSAALPSGDIDRSDTLDIRDVTAMLNSLSLGSSDPGVCDLDGNGAVDILDVTVLLNLLGGSTRQSLKKGDILSFGSYEQDNDRANGKEAIEWTVLDVVDGKALLLSRYALDCLQFSTAVDITWECSSLRAWLNSDFFREAFSPAERHVIQKTALETEDNPSWNRVEPDTLDRVFLLSLNDMKNPDYGFVEDFAVPDEARGCQATAYAKAQGCKTSTNGNCSWWLRSPGNEPSIISRSFVEADGSVDYGGIVSYYVDGVRPALWIDADRRSDPRHAPQVLPAESPTCTKDGLTEGSVCAGCDEILVPRQTVQALGHNFVDGVCIRCRKIEHITGVLPGDILTFGSYEQDNDLTNGKEAIEWIVLDVVDGKALLFSKYALDWQQFEKSYRVPAPWGSSHLRSWLNSDFFADAFNEGEADRILPTVLRETSDGTEDLVFLLDRADVANSAYGFDSDYAAYDPARRCQPTAYVRSLSNLQFASGNCTWWLRTPGEGTLMTAATTCVQESGNAQYQYNSREYQAVRPAIWIEL